MDAGSVRSRGVGNVICRSARSGAPVVDLLTDLAHEKRVQFA